MPSPLFFLHKKLLFDLSIFLIVQIIISVFFLFLICKSTTIFNLEFPLNIFLVSFTSSGITVGILDKIEIYTSQDETVKLNKIREFINEFRNKIIKNINKQETAVNREYGMKLERMYTLAELKTECRNLFKDKFSEIEQACGDDKPLYAQAIVDENIPYARKLLESVKKL